MIRKKVLVIEDNDDSAELLRRTLSAYKVRIAPNVQRGVEQSLSFGPPSAGLAARPVSPCKLAHLKM